MTAVMLHHPSIDNSHTAENPADNGDFKYDTHGEAGHHQGVHIGIDGDGVGHHFAYLISAEETENEGEDEVIGEQYAKDEHDVSATDEAKGILPLVCIEGWGDEVEQLVDEVGRCE